MTYRDYILQTPFEEVWRHLYHLYGEAPELKDSYRKLYDALRALPSAPTDAQILLKRDALGDVRAENTLEMQEALIDREVVLSEEVAGEVSEVAAHLLYWSSMYGFETAAQFDDGFERWSATVQTGPCYDLKGRMVKYLFLDFDGVLNNGRYLMEQALSGEASRDRYGKLFDPKAVVRLKRLLEATRARILVVSSWRFAYDRATLNAMWKERGMPGEIDHVLNTEIADDERGRGVKEFHIEKYVPYVILDDEDTYLPEQKPYLIRINPLNGLTDEDVERAIGILNRFDDGSWRKDAPRFASDRYGARGMSEAHSLARKRLRFWRDAIFHDSSMDWAWILEILAGKLEYDIGFWKYVRRHVDWEHDVKRMELCRKLMNIVIDDHAEMEKTHVNPGNAARYGKRIDDWEFFDYSLLDLRREKAFSILWRLLDHNMKRWRD